MRFAYTVRIDITYYVYNTMCINYYNCLFAIFFFLVASTLTCFRCGPRLVALVFYALRRFVCAFVSTLKVICTICVHSAAYSSSRIWLMQSVRQRKVRQNRQASKLISQSSETQTSRAKRACESRKRDLK